MGKEQHSSNSTPSAEEFIDPIDEESIGPSNPTYVKLKRRELLFRHPLIAQKMQLPLDE
jgi:hypothetical protein